MPNMPNMPKSRASGAASFNRHDRVRLAKALAQTKEARCYRRLQAVLLLAQGQSIEAVAQLSQSNISTVYRWRTRYLRVHSVEDLADQPRCGRPSAANRLTDVRLAQALQQDPLQLGYNTTSWTVALLATYLNQRFRCGVTPRTLRQRLHAAGYRWKRPRYVYSAKEPHRAQKKGPLSAV